jgi:type I restriction enzyme S subunit
MTDLPKGWEWTTLGELGAPEPRAITDGPFGSNLKSSHYVDAGPRVIRLQNIGLGEFVDEEAHISEEHFETLRAHEAEPGDLVVASLGQDLPRACIVPATLGPAIVKADCIRVRLHSEIDARFVNYALQRSALKRAVADKVHGVGRPRLGMVGIKELSIPLPPRAEQDRIVAAIEEHLSRIDAAEFAVGAAMVRMNRATHALEEQLIERSGPLQPVASFAAPTKNAMAIGPFGSNLKVSDYRDAGVPLVFVRDIRRGRFGGEGTKFVTETKAQSLASHVARSGDVVVTKMGDPPGDAAVYTGPDAVITADCI